MLFKAIALTLSTLFLAAIQVSTADAGCGRHGRIYQSKISKSYALKPSRHRKPRTVATAKPRKAVQQASAKKVKSIAPETAAVSEPSPVEESIVKADANEKSDVNVAAIKKTCTKFIAETGTTVTFECTQQ